MRTTTIFQPVGVSGLVSKVSPALTLPSPASGRGLEFGISPHKQAGGEFYIIPSPTCGRG
jgi:hypothetical protein